MNLMRAKGTIALMVIGIFRRFRQNHKLKKTREDANLPLANPNVQLTRKELDYAIALIMRRPWLQDRSGQLEETIAKVVSKVSGADKLFKTLIYRFSFVSKEESDRRLGLLIKQFEEQWNVPKDTTVIMAVCKIGNEHGDGSQRLLADLKRDMTRWDENRFYDKFDTSNKRIQGGYNVILIDDFVGSGGTVGKRIDELLRVVSPNAKIFIASLGATKISKSYLAQKYPQVPFYAAEYVKMGFNPDASSHKKQIMLEMESCLSKKYKSYEMKQYSLGYNNTCSVYYNAAYRIPNNVFPIFWWGKLSNGDDFHSLFLRT